MYSNATITKFKWYRYRNKVPKQYAVTIEAAAAVVGIFLCTRYGSLSMMFKNKKAGIYSKIVTSKTVTLGHIFFVEKKHN